MDRKAKLLAGVAREHKVLEIGPSYNPTVTRRDGWNVFSLDHAPAAELRKHYGSKPGVDVSRIEEVDFVWKGGPLESAIPAEHLGTFDVIIASHVIEHQPNLVGFFQSTSRILKPGGLLRLAVPDKRFCFDFFMPVTLTGDVLEAAFAESTRHTKRSRYHHSAYHVFINKNSTWTQAPIEELSWRKDNIHVAKTAFDAHQTGPEAPYFDLHAWYFTPAHFKLILLELGHLDLIQYREEAYFGPAGCEFIISLRNTKPQRLDEAALQARRLELLTQGLLEIREQADFVLQGMGPGASGGEPGAHQAISLEMEVRKKLEGRVDEMTHEVADMAAQLAALKRELAAKEESHQQLHAAIKRWNRRPWYSRALHKLRDAALRPPVSQTAES